MDRMGALPWSMRTLKPDELLAGHNAMTPPASPSRIPPTVSESSPLPRSKTAASERRTTANQDFTVHHAAAFLVS